MKIRTLIIFCTILITFFTNQYTNAGTTGKVSGYVYDKSTGEPLIGSNVLIEGTTIGAATDKDGYYNLINVRPGKYTLIFRFMGYTPLKIENVEVSVDRTTKIDAELSTESIGIEEVVIKAERPPIQKDRTYSASVVNSETINTMPVTTLQEVIKLQPGVVSTGGELHFRGGRSREVAYLIDGIPVTNSFNQNGGNNVVIENSMVQELEVISGTFNAEYGSAQSGIVNVITKGISDRFQGSFKTYAGDWVSSQDDVFIGVDDVDPVDEKDFQFSLSGPIKRDVLGFSVSGRYNKSNSLRWYERRYNPVDGWRIAAYKQWFQEQRSDDIGATQGIPIPDSLKTGDGSKGPLAEYENISLNAKLNYFPFKGFNISYQTFASINETEGASTSELLNSRRYQPDETGTSNSWSLHHFLSIKHSLSNEFFYTLGFSYQHNNFGDDYYRKDNKIAQYPDDEGIQPITASADGFSLGDTGGFYTGADDKNFRDLYLVHGNFNWQVNKYNLVKAGFEFKQHKVNTYDWGYVETKEWETKKWLNFDPDPSLDFATYWDLMVNYWKNWNEEFNTTKYRKYDESEYTNWRDYTIEPIEFSFYVQDKVELGEIIINGGLRFDAFLPQEKVPANYRTESFLLGSNENLVDASNKYQLSPRLGISFPISDRGVFHAAYGHFFQMPSFEKMYNRPLYTYNAIQLNDKLLGNADLKPEKTVQYEIGVQQQITDEIAVDVTAYYKDIMNLLGVEKITTIDAVGYRRYINRDYGNSKGITIGLRKTGSGLITGAVNYSFSYSNGSASDPEKLELINSSTQIGGDPVQFVDRKILPLDWDQRHTLNVVVNFSRVNDWSVGLIGSLNSGNPYSPEFIERYDIPEREFINRGTKPLRWSVDLKMKKVFDFNNIRYVVFLKIDNLLDHLNQESVFSTSGTADSNVRLPETEDLEKERLSQEGHFSLEEIDNRPQWYSAPRKVTFGFEIYF